MLVDVILTSPMPRASFCIPGHGSICSYEALLDKKSYSVYFFPAASGSNDFHYRISREGVLVGAIDLVRTIAGRLTSAVPLPYLEIGWYDRRYILYAAQSLGAGGIHILTKSDGTRAGEITDLGTNANGGQPTFRISTDMTDELPMFVFAAMVLSCTNI